MEMKSFFKLSYGLYVVTTKFQEKCSGCVINTMTQVTSTPSQVCITINHSNYTTELIKESGVFNVSVLLESVPMEVIRQFGFQSGRDVNKFKDGQYGKDLNGVYYLKEHSAAMFACRVNKMIDVGTHVMIVAEVVDARVLSDEPVLTYSAYHDKKNGTTPTSAPSYIAEPQKKGWVCDVCGYIYEGDVLPEGFTCPICHVDASHFHQQ